MPDVFLHDTYITSTSAGRWAFVLLSFALGGTLGSFLNVVVYRLPRRMSLSFPGSHCPACGKPIRWHDNVPIFGWLWLGGRCRDCRAPISPRYPLVEALVATASAALAWAELFVPIPPPAFDLPAEYALNLGPYGFHLLLICALIVAALMEYDGHRPPPRMLSLVMAIGLAAGGMWPELRSHAALGASHLAGVLDGVLGGLTALALASLAWPAWVARADREHIARGSTAVAELVLVGIYLGTRELAVAAGVAMLLSTLSRLLGRVWPWWARFGWAGCLAVATLGTIVAMRSAGELDARLLEYDTTTTLIGAGIAIAVAAVAARFAGSARNRAAS
ncbi:MAG: prepilin peptidase [Pirellulales bacterium]